MFFTPCSKSLSNYQFSQHCSYILFKAGWENLRSGYLNIRKPQYILLQLFGRRYKGLVNIFVKIYTEEGLHAFYRGFVPTLIGIIPYAGTSFFVYETCKNLYSSFYPDKSPHPVHRLAFGACAGLLGQSLTYPLEIVRRRMQTDGIHGTPNPEYRHMLTTMKYVYRTEGLFAGLYKGLSLNWVKGPIAVGISFTTFDILHAFLQKHYVESAWLDLCITPATPLVGCKILLGFAQ